MFTSEKVEAVTYENNLWESITNKQIIRKSVPSKINITVPLNDIREFMMITRIMKTAILFEKKQTIKGT